MVGRGAFGSPGASGFWLGFLVVRRRGGGPPHPPALAAAAAPTPDPAGATGVAEFAVGVPLPRARPVRRGAEAASSSSSAAGSGLGG